MAYLLRPLQKKIQRPKFPRHVSAGFRHFVSGISGSLLDSFDVVASRTREAGVVLRA